MNRKPTLAQLRFLGKVIRTTSCTCDTIGEFRARQACERNGWLEHRPMRPGYGMATYITAAAREAINSSAA